MIILICLVVFILLLFIFILVSPIKLVIDSTANDYYLNWRGIGRLLLLTRNKELILRLRTLVFHKDFDLLKPSKKETERKKKKIKKEDKKKANRFTIKKMNRMMKTFSVKTLKINLDTDNYITNGYMIPIFLFLKSPNKSLNINYIGHNQIKLIIENRLYKILKAYFF